MKNKRIISAIVLFAMIFGLMSVGFSVSAVVSTEWSTFELYTDAITNGGWTGKYNVEVNPEHDTTLYYGDSGKSFKLTYKAGQNESQAWFNWNGLDLQQQFTDEGILQLQIYNTSSFTTKLVFQDSNSKTISYDLNSKTYYDQSDSENLGKWVEVNVPLSVFTGDEDFDASSVTRFGMYADTTGLVSVDPTYYDAVKIVKPVVAADPVTAPPAIPDETVLIEYFSNGFSDGIAKYYGAGYDMTLSTSENLIQLDAQADADNTSIFIRKSDWSATDITAYMEATSNVYLQILVNNPSNGSLSMELTSDQGMMRASLDDNAVIETYDDGWKLYEIKLSDFATPSWSSSVFNPENFKFIGIHGHTKNKDAFTAFFDSIRIIEKASACTHEGDDHSQPATCKTPATCSVCQEEYGVVDSNNHVNTTEFNYTPIDETTHGVSYKCCNAPKETAEHNFADTNTCTACGYTKGTEIPPVEPEIPEEPEREPVNLFIYIMHLIMLKRAAAQTPDTPAVPGVPTSAPKATDNTTLFTVFSENVYGSDGKTGGAAEFGPYLDEYVQQEVVTLKDNSKVVKVSYNNDYTQFRHPQTWGKNWETYFADASKAHLQMNIFNPNALTLTVRLGSGGCWGTGRPELSLGAYTPVSSKDGWDLYEIKMSDFLKSDKLGDNFAKNNVNHIDIIAEGTGDIYFDDIRIIEK